MLPFSSTNGIINVIDRKMNNDIEHSTTDIEFEFCTLNS